ncbi:TPA: bifunctional hydroxymethylpyrimidine kinase/phosphomethylpyrimidine kinase [Staphylococcus aureus]|nr:bifunctional hydroxymethylpyrimidine kinase/phosphomethylpyrimidine kinase [Staphylococcus aureus]
MTNKVVILGSTNVDQFLTVERYAQPGETLHVEEAQKAFGGGKGANQAIISAFEIAKAHGVTTVLNPAPAKALPNELLSLIDIIVPNETEAELLSGIKVTNEQSMKDNANYFLSIGIKTVLITLGKQGTYFATKNQSQHIEAYKVNAIDTTAAGDTFIGAFVSRLNKSQDNLADAIDFGNKASSLTVQKHGAQASIPLLEEVNQV